MGGTTEQTGRAWPEAGPRPSRISWVMIGLRSRRGRGLQSRPGVARGETTPRPERARFVGLRSRRGRGRGEAGLRSGAWLPGGPAGWRGVAPEKGRGQAAEVLGPSPEGGGGDGPRGVSWRARGHSRPRPPRAHHGSQPAASTAAGPRAGARTGPVGRRGRGAGARHHPLLPRQLLELGPRQVHGLRFVPCTPAQRLLPRLRCDAPDQLSPAVAHLGGRLGAGLCAGVSVWFPGLEAVPQEREVYHPHRGDGR